MPTLNWIGKDAVINHHLEVPFHLLKDVPELACGDPGSGNLIVEGDNLKALKALLPYYKGKVKCIYIDPPYNTGNEGWVYNDNVNSPENKKWLGEVVGKEGETLDRHDRWLCMMYPRLALLQDFLSEDGVIFVNIDDNELANLRYLLDELFGVSRRLAVFTWVRKRKGSNLSKEFRKVTEYILAYKGGAGKVELKGVPAYAEKAVPLLNRPNPITVLKFPSGSLKAGRGLNDGSISPGIKGGDKGELAVELANTMRIEKGIVASDVTLIGRWRWQQSTVDHELENGSEFVLSKDFRINVYRYDQSSKFKAPQSLLTPEDGVGTNEDATDELRNIFADYSKLPFDFPKPSSLIAYLVKASTQPGDIILDSFGGSGTTAHAITAINNSSEKGDDRHFILVEMMPSTANEVARERVKRVAEGYTNAKGEAVAGLGGGFRYVRLGDELFDEHGRINEDKVRFADLARHVYFSETGEPLPKERISVKTPLLGVHHGRAIYLLYNGILKDKSVDGGNVLTTATLEHLPEHDGPKVVYAAACRFSKARLEREGIIFKQTPYAIRTR